MPRYSDRGFHWSVHDVRDLLPPSWQDEVRSTVTRNATHQVLAGDSVTSREAKGTTIESIVVPGMAVSSELPWLDVLYRSKLRDLATREAGEPVVCARDNLYGVVLNVQRGSQMRYEAHVDSNPVQGLLYLTDHALGSGGELAVARDSDAGTVDEIDADCVVIPPVAGTAVLFDGRRHPHYVRPLTSDEDVRIVAAMNFYTDSSPESDRPADLNRHLFGNKP
jgi:2OG-Fe(II) oxygenase superfamily